MGAVKLYSHFRSSSTWRVRIALNWKGIAYDYVTVSLTKDDHLSPEYKQVNPQRAVPALEIDGLVLGESMAIIEYLDETRPQPPLLPGTPAERAEIRRVAEAINSGAQPFQNLKVLRRLESQFGANAEAKKAWASAFISEAFTAIETLLAGRSGQCCFGDTVTLADVYLPPQMYGARRFGVDLTPFPTLVSVEKYLKALPAFARAEPGQQPDAPPEER